ncbi:MAG: hypothetical protein A2W03_14225 [Candidatus Aminicenantes bacterium RBG_16_63_16]|nr:MAG: hypothetical protein A2W03_14225 [Candidatus Aminicenantes bacterium RBG_16_63_16]
MRFGSYGILIAFAAFILLLILNPRLSCFGKRIRSPLYPLLRKRRQKAPPPVKTEDYGFRLGEGQPAKDGPRQPAGHREKAAKKTDDYGFRLD